MPNSGHVITDLSKADNRLSALTRKWSKHKNQSKYLKDPCEVCVMIIDKIKGLSGPQEISRF